MPWPVQLFQQIPDVVQLDSRSQSQRARLDHKGSCLGGLRGQAASARQTAITGKGLPAICSICGATVLSVFGSP